MNQIDVFELKKMLHQHIPLQIIDVREEWEYDICNLGGVSIPMESIPERVGEISKDRKVIVHCHSGIRSANVIQFLEQTYRFENLYNLEGGIAEWIRKIDPTMTDY